MTALCNQDPTAAASDYNLWQTYFAAAMLQIQTVSLVRVESCTNSGGVVPAGTVNATVLVNIVTVDRTAIPHGTINNIPYSRAQGGSSAIILDPAPQDIGIALFCSRDISIVKKTMAQANPGSYRMFDWADGLYIGGFLNGSPTTFIQFDGNGNINLKTPSGVVTINGTTIDADGNIKGAGSITDGDGIVVGTHTHSGVESGPDNSGPPVPV
jgi:GpV Apex motif